MKILVPPESLSDDTAHAPYGALRHGKRKHIFRNKKMFSFVPDSFFIPAAAPAVTFQGNALDVM